MATEINKQKHGKHHEAKTKKSGARQRHENLQ